MIYLIGSLRNPEIPTIAARLRDEGHEVFDDWFAAGPEADDWWKSYEQARGHNLKQALKGYAARHVVEFDEHHIRRAKAVVLVLPAGKSGHLELGFGLALDKPGFVLGAADAERFDVMYALGRGAEVCYSLDELVEEVRKAGL